MKHEAEKNAMDKLKDMAGPETKIVWSNNPYKWLLRNVKPIPGGTTELTLKEAVADGHAPHGLLAEIDKKAAQKFGHRFFLLLRPGRGILQTLGTFAHEVGHIYQARHKIRRGCPIKYEKEADCWGLEFMMNMNALEALRDRIKVLQKYRRYLLAQEIIKTKVFKKALRMVRG